MSKHTQRTLKYFRDQGYFCDIVERWLIIPGHPGGGKRRDCFFFGDILAFNNSETIMIQSCGQSYAKHLRDLLANPNVPLWLAGPRKLILIGWRKILKKRGRKQKIWSPRIKEITYRDFKEGI